MYFGAEHLIGFFTWFPSAQWYLRKGGNYYPQNYSLVLIIFLCWKVGKLLYPHLILWACTHNSAGLLSAELGDGAIQHVDLVEEVHRVHRHPPDRQGSIVHSWYLNRSGNLTHWCPPPLVASQPTSDYLKVDFHLELKLWRKSTKTWSKGCSSMLHQFMLLASLRDVLLRLERLRGPVSK